MRPEDFDYELPAELIAQYPVADREGSRMLVMDRCTGGCSVRRFRDLPDRLRAGDLLVVNDTRVLAARLRGHRDPTGGQVEILLLEPQGDERWRAMMRPGRRLGRGDRIALDGAPGESLEVTGCLPGGEFELESKGRSVAELLEECGEIPLPPYIRREAEAGDRARYQTVYAAKPGAVAAPTAGLHFTPEMFSRLRDKGVEHAAVTLHVGPGTFRPVKAERIEQHAMHEERFILSAGTAAAVNETRDRGGRVIAVGTTVVRVLESCMHTVSGRVEPRTGRTRLFLHPPKEPRVTDGLLTNFHLPRSTLLMLVCTFSSIENVLAAYRLAVRERMRFYSYGDCMLVI